jgi:predicted dehydrogenase
MQFDCWLPTGRRRDDRQEDMTLRIGIVGCGKIADAHIEQIRAIGGAEVVALCDTEPLMARQLGTRFGIAAQYSNLVEMLGSQKLDVVHITTPPNSHVAIALQAIAAGCHVFVEKPFALDAVGGRTILEAARTAGRKVSINYWYNFEPPSDELRALIAKGVLGDPVHVDSILGYDLSGDYGTAVLGDAGHWVHSLPGKLFHNVLDHVVSKMVLFLPDQEPTVSVLDYRRRPASGNAVLDAVADELRFLVRAGSVSAFGMISAQARPAAHLLRVTARETPSRWTTTIAPWRSTRSSAFPARSVGSSLHSLARRNIAAADGAICGSSARQSSTTSRACASCWKRSTPVSGRARHRRSLMRRCCG